MPSSKLPNGGITLNGEMTLGVDVVWVTETVDRDEDGVQDDQVWTDWLVAEGYDVDVQMDHWMTLGDDKDPNDTTDYVGELNLADLVIISRTASSGAYATDAAEVEAWGSVTTPILSLSAWHVRSSRLKWINSTTVNRTLDTYMLALETDHPVLDGVALEDGLVEMVFTEGFADGYQGNCVIGGTDVGNGVLIGQSFSDETMVAEWPAGVEAYEGAGLVQAGPRLLLCAGTENASLTANLLPQGAWNLTDAGEMMFRNAINYMVSLPPAGAKIVFVTSVKDNDADGIQDDVSWVDWLKARGYNVDARPGNWIDPMDPNKIAELEAADLIIASRGMATGEYDGAETAKWNSLSTPVICINAWMIRSNRWVWMNSTSANKDAGSPILMALETRHPIFDDVELDSDGLVEILDPDVGSGHTSFLTDILDVGNGTLLAQSLGIYNTAWVVEWPAGVEYYTGAGQIASGRRMLFMAGTQDDPYTDANGNIMPVGILNLNDAGKQMFHNAIEYMLTPPPPTVVFVTSVKDNDADGVQDDVSWADWLEAEGYNVDFRPGNWIDPLDDDKIAELEAADLIIASRGMATGEYDGAETDKWNAISTPTICINAWMIRSNRWVWMNSTSANKDAGSPILMALETTHPIYDGVELDQDGLVEILDPDVASGNTSFLTDILDVGNGTLLAQSLGIYNTAWIVEWPAGVEYYAGSVQTTGGKRMLFMAGTQDDPYLAPDGVNIAPVGVLNLNDAGKKMFLNAVKYMLPVKPVDPGTDGLVAYYPLDGDVLDSSGNELDGTIMGDPNFVEGIIGMALQTDGVDDYVDCGNDPLFDFTEQITLAIWVNVNDFGNGQNDPWINKGDHSWCIKGHRTGYAIEFFVYEGTWNWISAEVGDLNNEWHHAAGTFDGTQLKIYVDGAEVATKDYVGGIATSTHNVAIGTNTEASGRFSEGLHDEVYIYNRALSAAEILYLAGQ